MSSVPHDDVVDRIYEASVLPDFWPDVLKTFATMADSREGVMLAADGDQYTWITSSPEAEFVAQGNYRHEGGTERTRRLLALPHAGFVTDLDVFTQDEMMAMPVYSDFLIPNGYGRGVATVVRLPQQQSIVFHAEGDFGLGGVQQETIARLDGLRPHLARSALVSARLSFERARTAVETLAGVGFAACAVRRDGSVLVANGGFESDTTFWTTRFNDRIALQDKAADRQLAETLDVILSDQGVRSIPIRPAPEAQPGVLHVVPVRRAVHDLFNQAAAILVLTKPDRNPVAQTPLLQALFDLTATEAQLAARIAAGQSVEQIAILDAKGVETVRTQLKSVLAKTGCRRQSDLARLLSQLIPSGM